MTQAAPPPAAVQTTLRGILLKILSVTLFTAMAACIKAAAGDGIPPGERMFFRSLFAIPVIVGWLALQRDLAHGWETRNPMGHLWRGLVGGGAMACGFTALGLLPLPEVTAINYAAPLLIVIFAAMFLGEQVRLFRLSAVALGLVGVVIVLSPRLSVASVDGLTQAESLGAMIALMGAVLAALAQVFIRKLVQTETTAAIVLWFSVTTTILSLFSAPFGWVWPGPFTAVLLVAAGLLGGFGQIFLTQAYRYAPTGVVAPFEYTSMVLAIIVGMVFFAEVPTLRTLAGASLVIAAGLIIIWRERQLGLERGGARRAMTPQG